MTKRLILILAVGLAALPAFCAPTIASNGVKNAASYANPAFPNGSIAQGSIFNIFGSGMGPTALAYATSLPLPTTLSNTSINVTVGGTTVACFMIYTSAGQVAAILPSNTPVGTGTITISYNGAASATAPIKVAASSFGIFTLNQQGSGPGVIQDGNYKFNSPVFAFQPGETVVLWGTGLGPISGSDANTPPTGNLPGISVAVTVGGAAAKVTYAGRSGYSGDDQVAFTIPNGVTGCYVPVAVTVSAANGTNPVVSNFATMSIDNTTTCSDPNLPGGVLQSGSPFRLGSVALTRSQSSFSILGMTTNFTTDAGVASFQRYDPSVYLNNSIGYYSLTDGACTIYTITGTSSGTPPTPTYMGLDAGTVINVNGPNGAKQITKQTAGGLIGLYDSTFGMIGLTLPGQTNQPLYLDPGTYAVDNGSGGADVGPFKANIIVPPTFTWTNYASITAVPRSQPLMVTWSGGDPNATVYVIGSSSVTSGDSATFECQAKDSAGGLTVPVTILQALPPSATISGTPTGGLNVLTYNFTTATVPSGLDYFGVGFEQIITKTGIPYQ